LDFAKTGIKIEFDLQCVIFDLLFDYDKITNLIIILVNGIGSILLLKNGLKKKCRKNDKNHLRSNNHQVYRAVAHFFSPNILDVMVLENINLSSDRHRAITVVV
jgi:hypothetical protein